MRYSQTTRQRDETLQQFGFAELCHNQPASGKPRPARAGLRSIGGENAANGDGNAANGGAENALSIFSNAASDKKNRKPDNNQRNRNN
jgi:hypothetical protein